MPDDPDPDGPEPLVRIVDLCVEIERLVDPEAMPEIHRAMQALMKAVGMEIARRLRASGMH